MSKTTARTFIAAAVLLVACVATTLYRHHLAESRRYAGEEQFIMYDRFDTQLDSWERLSGLTGLLAFSVTVAGALLWDRDIYPRAQRGSILGLEGSTARRIVSVDAPLKNPAIAEAHTNESNAQSHEDEYLTPLERVIRGY
jgi:hypothetical protein